jgi:O-acetyl-ADP-ribose deacetylase
MRYAIALPALGTGVGGLDLTACAREMIAAVSEHFAAHPDCPVRRVVFVVRDAEAKHTFMEAIHRHEG